MNDTGLPTGATPPEPAGLSPPAGAGGASDGDVRLRAALQPPARLGDPGVEIDAASSAPAPMRAPPASGPPAPHAGAIADGLERRLENSYIRADSLSWWILVGVVAVVGLVGLLILGIAVDEVIAWVLGLVAWLALVGASVLGAVRWPRLAWRHASYIVHPAGIEIRQGVLWRRITSVPRSRVQHIDVVQGPVLRRYGLATLTIHTAGTEEAVVGLAGVSLETATRIRDVLLGESAPRGLLRPERGPDGV